MKHRSLIFTSILLTLVVSISALTMVFWESSQMLVTTPRDGVAQVEGDGGFGHANHVAVNWSGDAKLLSAQATWTEDGTASWDYTFYSADLAARALVSIEDGAALLVKVEPMPGSRSPASGRLASATQ